MNKPVVNGKASICHWNLAVMFRDKTQVQDFIDMLLKDEIDFDFSLVKELDETSEYYVLTIEGTWANNLVRVSKLVEYVDYDLEKQKD